MCSIFIIATLCFIWGNSFESGESSMELSSDLQSRFSFIFSLFPADLSDELKSYIFRKLAHFTEFFMLGCEIAVTNLLCFKARLKNISNIVLFGISVALIDETIQLFTGRTSQVQDVILDFCGYICGTVFVLAFVFIIKCLKHKKLK